MQFKTDKSPLGGMSNVASVMRQVLYALVPGIAVMTYFYSWGVLINIVFSIMIALSFEAA